MCSVVFNFCMYVCMHVCCVFAPLPRKNGIADWFEVKFKINQSINHFLRVYAIINTCIYPCENVTLVLHLPISLADISLRRSILNLDNLLIVSNFKLGNWLSG